MRLIDADKAVQELQDYYHGCYSEVQLAPYQVDRWITQQPTVMAWIPVTERMPERRQFVLVSGLNISDDGVYRCISLAFWDYDDTADDGWSWRFPEGDDVDFEVLTWMPRISLSETRKKEEIR